MSIISVLCQNLVKIILQKFILIKSFLWRLLDYLNYLFIMKFFLIFLNEHIKQYNSKQRHMDQELEFVCHPFLGMLFSALSKWKFPLSKYKVAFRLLDGRNFSKFSQLKVYSLDNLNYLSRTKLSMLSNNWSPCQKLFKQTSRNYSLISYVCLLKFIDKLELSHQKSAKE